MKNIFEILQPPFHYDETGQMIFDKNNQMCLDVRAWGLLQYEENGEQLQDDFGKKVADALTKLAQQSLDELCDSFQDRHDG